ncbi:MAG: ATP-binding protein [Bacteroidetes bacterium]|nr:ATP-binding protein [Bacteroidota bacterium]MCL5738614.1 ATP-binding protein [Bacteroidota bacterium]
MNTRKFDLNIEKVLEDWESYHAIREVIANALDENILSKTKEIQISQDSAGAWHIRDFGRGLRYEHLTQNENEEKLKNPQLIGKFGVGLKDALATFDRRGIKVLIKSRFGDITLGKSEKHDFEDLVTLHAYVSNPTEPTLVGTDFVLQGCTEKDIEKAKDLFLRFSSEPVFEKTQYGEVLRKKSEAGRIYLNGVKVAEEENFLFSYNITSLTAAIKKALNRERTNVGRTAYSDRVKSILLSCESGTVAQQLVDDLKRYQTGAIHDELKWADVSAHATKILNSQEKVVFLTPTQLMQAPNYIDEAKKAGYEIVTIPDSVKSKISGQTDISGNPIQDLGQFQRDWNDSFQFKFVDPHRLSPREKTVYDSIPKIAALIGGLPANVKHIKISETMRMETYAFVEAAGIWESATGTIIIKRTQLRSLEEFAGTLLHEIGHARSGAPDVSSDFEKSLTELLGKTGSCIAGTHSNSGLLSKIFGG